MVSGFRFHGFRFQVSGFGFQVYAICLATWVLFFKFGIYEICLFSQKSEVCVNLKPETRNLKPKTRNLKPETRNLKPET
jgi:hypothetical protein